MRDETEKSAEERRKNLEDEDAEEDTDGHVNEDGCVDAGAEEDE